MNNIIGTVDRAIRLVLGVALIVVALYGSLAFLDGAIAKYTAFIIGVVLVVTGLVGTCPAYSVFGIQTCKSLSIEKRLLRIGSRLIAVP